MRMIGRVISYSLVIGLASVAMAFPPVNTAHIAANWNNNNIEYLDANMQLLGGFSSGGTLPNGTAFDGRFIYSGHFVGQEVRVFDMDGNFQYNWNAQLANLQGMEYINQTGELAIYNDGGTNLIQFHDPANGNLLRSVPGQSSSVEGLAWDGTYLWQLEDALIYATDVTNGNILFTIPNPAANESFGGTGIDAPSATELVVGSSSGNWWRIDSTNGNILASGNNGVAMYGLSAIPEPGSLTLLAIGIAGLLRRR